MLSKIKLGLAIAVAALSFVLPIPISTLALQPNEDTLSEEDYNNLQRGVAAYQNKVYEDAFSVLEPLAHMNSAEAQFFVGQMFISGDGVRQDFDAGFLWLHASADQGLQQAVDSLNYKYKRVLQPGIFMTLTDETSIPEGFYDGVYGRTFRQAMKWFSPRAETNDPYSLHFLGLVYWYGIYRDVDKGLGMQYMSEAYELGSEEAAIELQFMKTDEP